MKVGAYYNEFDKDAVFVLRHLIKTGLIAPGDVDDRSIKEVQPDDLKGYTQCHFFAGAGIWSLALRSAGWSDSRTVWTGSPPCQPFSSAGKGAGTDDVRHLWPDFFRLIRACRPPLVFGEQVSAAAGKRIKVDENLHHLWAAENLSGFLQGQGIARQFDWLSCEMQNLLPGASNEISDWYDQAAVGSLQTLAGQESWCRSGGRREESREDCESSVRSGSVQGGDSNSDRSRGLRDVRASVPPGRWPDLGQSFTGPDQSERGLCDNERSHHSVRVECDDEHLGRGTGVGDSGVGETDSGGGREQHIGPLGKAAEGTLVPDWLDGVRFDLDTISYSFGHTDIPACAVDAPHIRNRLYWVAVGDAARGGGSGAGRSEAHHGEAGRGEHRGSDAGDRHLDLADAGGRSVRLGGPTEDHRSSGEAGGEVRQQRVRIDPRTVDLFGGLGDADGEGRDERAGACGLGGGLDEPAHPADADVAVAARVGGSRAREGGAGVRSRECAVGGHDRDGGFLGDAFGAGLEGQRGDVADGDRSGWDEPYAARSASPPNGRNGSFWAGDIWILCHDGKARRAESNLCDAPDGVAGRVPAGGGASGGDAAANASQEAEEGPERLRLDRRLLVQNMPGRIPAWRLAGNAIVAPLAVEVIAALMDVLDEPVHKHISNVFD